LKIKRAYLDKIKYRSLQENGKRIIEAVIPYNSPSRDLGGYREVILPTAFNKTLGDGQNVYALFNHDDGKVLGSTKSGTFELRSEKKGLFCKLLLGESSWANDTWDVVSRGDCNTLSFGFEPHEVENRANTRYLRSVQLFEVSFCVSNPAYDETQSIAYKRSLSMLKRNIDIDVLSDIISREELTEDDLLILKGYIDELQKLIPAGASTEGSTKSDPPKKEEDRKSDSATETEAMKKIAELEQKIAQMEESQKAATDAAIESIQEEIDQELERDLTDDEDEKEAA
jgi:HK97 family phage prohead protease